MKNLKGRKNHNLDQEIKKSFFEKVNSFTLDFLFSFYRKTGLKKTGSNYSTILCYHSVADSGWRFSTKITDFHEQLEYINKNFSIVPLEDILSGRQSGPGIALTFDDGYADIYKNVLPVLKKYGIKATVFVLGERNNPNRKELDNKLPLLTLNQIKELHSLGWEIGYHTNTHSHLAKLSDSELQREIISSKKNLEKTLGFKIRYFAYPKGIYS